MIKTKIAQLYITLTICFTLLAPPLVISQNTRHANDPVTLGEIIAQTKQLNQFILRFNGEEAKTGKRLYAQDHQYHDPNLRKLYLKHLFDNRNVTITESSKNKFQQHIFTKPEKYLDLHNTKWFAETKTSFLYEGKEQELTIYLNFEQKDLGWQWVISGIYFKPYHDYFARPTLKSGEILHPKSHEIDFMTLNKAMNQPNKILGYTPKNFSPDFLTIFVNDVKRRKLKFQSVNEVKFHFFQIDNYYFQISEFIRGGQNTGWLISNLVELPENEKEEFIKLIRYETF